MGLSHHPETAMQPNRELQSIALLFKGCVVPSSDTTIACFALPMSQLANTTPKAIRCKDTIRQNMFDSIYKFDLLVVNIVQLW